MPSSRISRSTYDFCPMRLKEDPLPSRKQGGPLDGQFGPTRLNQPPEAVLDVTVDQQASCGFSSAPSSSRRGKGALPVRVMCPEPFPA